MKPLNYRDVDECIVCKHCTHTHPCGCCPPEYKCLKHNYVICEEMICDDFESDEQEAENE